MKNIDLTNVKEAGDFERLTPGGYICVIKAVEDFPEKEYLRIEFDIAAGELAGYYQRTYERAGFWGGEMRRSYKDAALPFFKAFITSVEASNAGYHWDNDESKLVGKKLGLVISEEEYRNKAGEIKVRMVADRCHSIQKIQAGEFTVPPIKKLKDDGFRNKPAQIGGGSVAADFAEPTSNQECPFA